MTTETFANQNRDLGRRLADTCFNPPSPARVAEFTTSMRSLAIFESFAMAFPDASLAVDWIAADSERVVIGGQITATHGGDWRGVASTGATVAFASVISLSIGEGSVTDVRVVSDSLAIAEQIGAVAPLGPKACQVLPVGLREHEERPAPKLDEHRIGTAD